jgi:hypothetical protein
MGLATIEDTFNRMAKALERLADATEATQKALMHARGTSATPDSDPPLDIKQRGVLPLNVLQIHAKEPSDSIPYETINKAILSYSDRFGQEAAKGLLKRFGATIIKDLKANPAKYAEVLEATKVGP